MREILFVKILFVELLGGLGDALIALRAIQALARSHEDARLTVLTFPPGADLLEGDPLIREVVRAPASPGGAREAVEDLLARERWDLVVSDVSYEGIGDLIRESGAGRTVTDLWRSPPPDERVGERFVEILVSGGVIQPSAIAPPRLHLAPEERARAAAGLSGVRRPLVFLIPDAGMRVKRWPDERWGALGRELMERNGASIVVPVGSDPGGAERVARLSGGSASVWPRGTLRGLASALSHADLVVAADTGPARIAASLGIPTVTLFGPSWHGRYGQPPPHANLQGHPGCPQRDVADFTRQPCWFGGACTLQDAPWRTCLEEVSVESVLDEASRLLPREGIAPTAEGER